MIDLIFDTETTGKYNFNKSPEDESQPCITQLGMALYKDRELKAEFGFLVYPKKEVEQEASKLTGITTQEARLFGCTVQAMLDWFHEYLSMADRLVAHNLKFDRNMILSACAKDEPPPSEFVKPKIEKINCYCTMLSSTEVCKLPGKFGKYKWPKLIEAYKILVDPEGFEGAHSALADVKACAKVLWALEDRGVELVKV